MKPATKITEQANARVLGELNFADKADFDDAQRGFIASMPNGVVLNAKGVTVWNSAAYAFEDEEQSPATVNPSLWRQARLNRPHGLFKVCDRIYQVRGYDIANITFVETDNGVVIIDALTFVEAAKASLELYYNHRPKKPVLAVIYSHSHADHYGGVTGLVSEEDVLAGKIQVIAPSGFLQAAVSENVLVGLPMRRRGQFQFGSTLAPGAMSHVDGGLGKAMGRGTVSLIAPTMTIEQNRETHVIDGLEIVFQLTPESEAPSEMHFFFPQLKALNLAENATRTMHNLCPLRGAQARDSLAWSKYLNDALNEFVPHADVVFAQHHWPVWGRELVAQYVGEQRDMYRFLHDQTLRLMNRGYTPKEIAEELMMPSTLSAKWHTRGYYGAIGHNVKAIYQRYFGWYDGNPASLNSLIPVDEGKKYVEYMGGTDRVIEQARKDFEQGNYRWVVQVLNHVVFADPSNTQARELEADAMEQLGYQAESATWRNAYVLGARELRQGVTKMPVGAGVANAKLIAPLPMEMIFDSLSVRIKGLEAQHLSIRVDWVVPDLGESYQLTLVNGVLNHSKGSHGAQADVTVTLNKTDLTTVLSGLGFKAAHENRSLKLTGQAEMFFQLLSLMEEPELNFNVVEP